MREKIRQKLHEIAQSYMGNTHCAESNIGLLSGKSGFSLFLFLYAKIYHDKKIEKKAFFYLEDTMHCIEQMETPYHTYCAGMAGVAWLFSFYEKIGILDNNISHEVNKYLYLLLLKEIEKGNLDFLHGAIGICYYFITTKQDEWAEKAIQKMLAFLELTSIKCDSTTLKWYSLNINNEKEFNISLSHGMAAIVAILTTLHKNSSKSVKERTETLIKGSTAYILKQEIDVHKYGSYFPYVALESTKKIVKSRLAWCYGDLGIAVTLYNAGIELEQNEWIRKSIDILEYAATYRRKLSDNAVVDACLCHGSAGIGLVFYRMWWNTKIDLFKEASDYWYAVTLDLASSKNGIAGYKTYNSITGTYENEHNILEGVAGIGLTLLSYGSELEPHWDKALLLS